MTTVQAFIVNMRVCDFIMETYLSDLSDADLMARPGPGCNHLAWQLGHLISSEQRLIETVVPGSAMPLPEAFDEKHSKKQKDNDDPKCFCTKEEYVDLFKKSRKNVRDAVAKMSDSDFDKPSPKGWEKMGPTMGAIVALIGHHGLMHAGQFAVARRKLGKPVVI